MVNAIILMEPAPPKNGQRDEAMPPSANKAQGVLHQFCGSKEGPVHHEKFNSIGSKILEK